MAQRGLLVTITAGEHGLGWGGMSMSQPEQRLAALERMRPTGRGPMSRPMADEFVRWDDEKLQAKLGLVGLVTALILWHTRRPNQHWIEGVVFLVSLAITWLGVALAH